MPVISQPDFTKIVGERKILYSKHHLSPQHGIEAFMEVTVETITE